MLSPPTFFLPTSAQDLARKCLFARAQLPRIASASLVHRGQLGPAFSGFGRKGMPLCRSRQSFHTKGNGFAASCSDMVSVHSNVFPHFSQRYWYVGMTQEPHSRCIANTASHHLAEKHLHFVERKGAQRLGAYIPREETLKENAVAVSSSGASQTAMTSY